MTPTGKVRICRIDTIEARLRDSGWTWAQRNRARIGAYWEELKAAKPDLYNGRVLVRADQQVDGASFRVSFIETDYASFLAHRDWGFPDPSVGNCFAMAALRGADGAFLLGRMAAHTANAGRVYFPAGTPDPGDVIAKGVVDLGGSVLRELEEETGLTSADVTIGGWTLVMVGARTALMQDITSSLSAKALSGLIERNLAQQDKPELAGTEIVADPADIDDEAMPAFMSAYLRWAFAQVVG